MPPVFAQTTTTEVPRVVGDPLPSWVVVLVGIAVLAVVLLAGLYLRRRMHPRDR